MSGIIFNNSKDAFIHIVKEHEVDVLLGERGI